MRCARRLSTGDQASAAVVTTVLRGEAESSRYDERTNTAVGARLVHAQFAGRVTRVVPLEVAALTSIPYPVVARKFLRVVAGAVGKMADVHQVGAHERIGTAKPLLTVVGGCNTTPVS